MATSAGVRKTVRRIGGGIWRYRRWGYAAWLLWSLTRIPARTGFRFAMPTCDWRPTADNLALSMTKVPHILLFGVFFLLTLVQFDRINRTSISLSLLATAAMSLLVEIQQGATRTGTCRLTDMAPNLLGGLLVAVPALMMAAMWRRQRTRPAGRRSETAARHDRAPG